MMSTLLGWLSKASRKFCTALAALGRLSQGGYRLNPDWRGVVMLGVSVSVLPTTA
jgi:hypothetical protein